MIKNQIKKIKFKILFSLIILGSFSEMNRVSAMESSEFNENSRRGILIKTTEFLENLKDEKLTIGGFPILLEEIVEFYNSTDSIKYKDLIDTAETEIELHKNNPDWAKGTKKGDKLLEEGSIKGSAVKKKITDTLEKIKNSEEKNANS